MTTQPDDRARDEAVDRAWADAARDQPPEHVDAAILAAARSAVEANKVTPLRPPGPRRIPHWQPLLAAAGVAGIAFVLLQVLPREADRPAATSPTKSQTVLGAPQPVTSNSAIARDEGPPSASTGVQETQVAAPTEPEQEVAPAEAGRLDASQAAADAAAAPSYAAKSAAGATMESAVPAPAVPAPAAAASAAPDSSERAVVASEEQVIDAYRRGDLGAAATALRRLRAQDPNADERLPPDLREWARSVR